MASASATAPVASAMSSGPSALMSDDSQSSAYLDELKSEEALDNFSKNQKHLYSTAPQHLTESDAEYVTVAIKHFFESVVILQYEIQNTLED
jgi:hypothetical protein